MISTDSLDWQSLREVFRPVINMVWIILILILIYVIIRIRQKKALRKLHNERKMKRRLR